MYARPLDLQDNGISAAKVVGFTTDGASVMTGCHTGLAERMKAISAFVLSFHCVAHKLQLACGDLFKQVGLC